MKPKKKLFSFSLERDKQNGRIIRRRVFLLSRILGKGASAVVVQASSTSLPGQDLAIKIFVNGYGRDGASAESLAKEISVLRLVRHPNIVKLKNILVERTRTGETHIQGLVFENCDMGDLFNYLSFSTGFPMSSEFIRAIFQQLVRGVAYLHSKNIVHNDIKPENVLLKSNGLVLLTDFGLSEIVKIESDESIATLSTSSSPMSPIASGLEATVKSASSTSVTLESLNPAKQGLTSSNFRKSKSLSNLTAAPLFISSNGGTLEYRAPETALKKLQHYDGAAADMWSLGVVLYVMVFGKLPRSSDLLPAALKKKQSNLFEKFKQDSWGHALSSAAQQSNSASAAVYSIASSLLQRNPKDRCLARDLIKTSWIDAAHLKGGVRTIRHELKRLRYYRKY